MKKILILTGDPNSINSELIFKVWKKINNNLKKKVVLISNYNLLIDQFKKLKYSVKIEKINNIKINFKSKNLKVLNVDLKFNDSFNIPNKNTSKFVISSLKLAHNLALGNDVKGIINCAIDKKLINKKNFGVTEFLATMCGLKNKSEVMLIRNNNFAVTPITTHVDIKNISKNLKKEVIINKIKTLNSWFKKNFKKKPRLGMLGLNPHNAELRKESEEKRLIIPVIQKIKKLGIKINGPLVADTVFIKDYKNYDIIIGMYHDQVLAPFKTIFKFDAINVTLGLKYLRVSPDHGVAKNLIRKNKANTLSLEKCISFINKFGR